jgi:hypothetical protein
MDLLAEKHHWVVDYVCFGEQYWTEIAQWTFTT